MVASHFFFMKDMESNLKMLMALGISQFSSMMWHVVYTSSEAKANAMKGMILQTRPQTNKRTHDAVANSSVHSHLLGIP
jgi:hypothetical protein